LKSIETKLFGQIDAVVNLARSRIDVETDEYKLACYGLIVDNFEVLKRRLELGSGPQIGSNIGIGAQRGLSDFGFYDEELFELAILTEAIYQTGLLNVGLE
jgi:hypothetical protein